MEGWTHVLEAVSSVSTQVIVLIAAVHGVLFLLLWWSYRQHVRAIAGVLDDFTRGVRHRSVLDRHSHLSDQIDAFLTDVNEVLENPARTEDRRTLLQRISILDEKRRYLESLRFEVSYTVCRTMIEAYPLLGILGTILAIGAALQAGDRASTTVIVQRFGEAIWSTCAGLVAAVLLMLFNSVVETQFLRLAESRRNVLLMVARAKSALLTPGDAPA